MRPQPLTAIFDKPSMYKYLGPNASRNTTSHAVADAKRIFNEIVDDAMSPTSGIRKIIMEGRGYKKNCGSRGINLTIVRNKKYLFLPPKKVTLTTKEMWFINQDDKAIRNAIRNLYDTAKEKLKLKVDPEDFAVSVFP